MKKIIIIFILCIFLNPVSAVIINEIEANPSGTDAGNEWIELFSESEIDLNGWKLVNNDGDEFFLNQTFSDYLIINFEKQWLDNKDEKLFLYDKEILIDETEIFSDSQNNDKTWQFCEKWEFIESTKEKKNNCAEDKEEKPEDSDNEEYQKDKKQNLVTGSTTKNITNETLKNKTKNIINLNPEKKTDEKTIYESKNENIKKYGIYAFALFLIFIIILIIKR